MHQTKISTKADEGGFSPAVFRSRLERKTPVFEYLVCCVRVLFSMAKSLLRMGSVFISVAKHFTPGGVCTPIALHCGSFVFNMAVKAAKIGRF